MSFWVSIHAYSIYLETVFLLHHPGIYLLILQVQLGYPFLQEALPDFLPGWGQMSPLCFLVPARPTGSCLGIDLSPQLDYETHDGRAGAAVVTTVSPH